MATGCCNLVGSFFNNTGFNLPIGCFISVNNNINTELSNQDCDLVGGVTVGTLNISGYADSGVFSGCPGRAGVTVLWQRKYDCSNDELHFIYGGEGRSFMSGNSESYVSLNKVFGQKTRTVNASSQSGPAALYTDIEQIEGIGMNYSKGPISFDTSSEGGVTLSNMGIGSGDYYLQTFNIELVPGSIPVANYTFAYAP